MIALRLGYLRVVAELLLLNSISLPAIAQAPVSTAHSTPDRKPNVIIILTDDMGIGDVSCYGKGIGVPTPNIDRLASEGVRFTQYYSAAPICSPSRAALLSGMIPGRLRLNSYLQTRSGNRNVDQNDYLDPAMAAMPVAFKKAGYATGHFGKWHLGGGRDVDNAPGIAEYGYDEWATTWESPDPHPDLGVKRTPWDREIEPGQVERHKRTEYMVNRTLDFLKRHKDQPCFINLWPDDVHTPHRPSPQMAEKYGAAEDERKTPKKSFMGVLEEYDRQMGRLFDGLKELGVEKDTIVIFTSDNGPEPHFSRERSGGLRGMKLSVYESGIRMPFIVRWPGHIPAGRVNEQTVLSEIDLLVTLSRLTNVELPREALDRMDGMDMSDAFLGKPITRSGALYWEYGRKPFGYGRPHIPYDRSPNLAIREKEYKLLINDDGTSRELYNLAEDRNETTNIADEKTALADELSSKVIAWRKTLPGRYHEEETTIARQFPNIIIFVADDLGYGDLGIQGSKEVETPNIDGIAREGIQFTNGYVSAPLCGPSRAGLLTGRYQQKFGFETNNGPSVTAVPHFGVPRNERMMSEYLKDVGYKTGMVGKWHLGFQKELAPPQRGFDFFFGFLSGYHGYFPDKPAPWESPIQRGNEEVTEPEYLTDALAREAVDFIQKNKKQPFFLYMPFSAVHSPLQAPAELLERFSHITDPRRRATLAMIASMDQAVGRVMQTLYQEHIFDGTIVFFLSDNGGPAAEGNNTPLRGAKGQLYEGGIRVPFMVQWWGHLPKNKVYKHPVSSLDILPTIFAAAGLPAPNANLDGVNLLPFLRGEDNGAPHETLYWRFNDKEKRKAIRYGNLKMVSENGPWELYDLSVDTSESINLAPSSASKVEELEKMWDNWNSGLQDPAWEGRRPPPAPKKNQKKAKATH